MRKPSDLEGVVDFTSSSHLRVGGDDMRGVVTGAFDEAALVSAAMGSAGWRPRSAASGRASALAGAAAGGPRRDRATPVMQPQSSHNQQSPLNPAAAGMGGDGANVDTAGTWQQHHGLGDSSGCAGRASSTAVMRGSMRLHAGGAQAHSGPAAGAPNTHNNRGSRPPSAFAGGSRSSLFAHSRADFPVDFSDLGVVAPAAADRTRARQRRETMAREGITDSAAAQSGRFGARANSAQPGRSGRSSVLPAWRPNKNLREELRKLVALQGDTALMRYDRNCNPQAAGDAPWAPLPKPELPFHRTILRGAFYDYDPTRSAFLVFSGDSVLRRRAFLILDNPYTDRFILAVSVAHAAAMLLAMPEFRTQMTLDILWWVHIAVQAIFTLELLLKLFILGLVLSPGAYFRSAWNIADGAVVAAGFAAFFVQEHLRLRLHVVRVVRLARVVRVFGALPGVRAVGDTISNSGKRLGDMLVLVVGALLFFAVVGLQVFTGTMQNVCVAPVPTSLAPFVDAGGLGEVTWNTTDLSGGAVSWVRDPHDAYSLCDIGAPPRSAGFFGGHGCRRGFECREVLGEYHRSYFTFQNLGSATLSAFRIMSMDDWHEETTRLQQTSGVVAFIFSFAIVLTLAYFSLNLIISILSYEYADVTREVQKSILAAELGSEVDQNALFGDNQGSAAVTGVAPELEQASAASSVAGHAVAATTETASTGSARSASQSSAGRPSTTAPSTAGSFVHRGDLASRNAGHTGLMSSGGSTSRGNTAAASSSGPGTPRAKKPKVVNLKKREGSGGGIIGILRDYLGVILNHRYIQASMLLLTVVNLVALMVVHHGMNASFSRIVSNVNLVCSVIFIVEVGLKVFSQGVEFLEDEFNVIDAAVCIASIPDMVSGGGSAFSVFRALRLVRALRVLPGTMRLRVMIVTVTRAAKASIFLFASLALFVYCGGVVLTIYIPDSIDASSRTNFTSLLNSMLSLFIVVTGEEWLAIASAVAEKEGIASLLFFIAYFCITHYLLLRFLVVVLIASFEQSSQVLEELKAEMAFQQGGVGSLSESASASGPVVPVDFRLNDLDMNALQLGVPQADDDEEGEDSSPLDLRYLDVPQSSSAPLRRLRAFVIALAGADDGEHVMPEPSLNLFARSNPVRVACLAMITNPFFELFIIATVLLSCVTLVLSGPDFDGNARMQTLNTVVTYLVPAIFAVELVVRVVARGVWQHPTAYLRSPWNIIDALVLLSTILTIPLPVLGFCRSFRAFKVASKLEPVRVVVEVISRILPIMGNVCVLLFFVVLMFAIFGVQQFAGSMVSCNDLAATNRSMCTGNYTAAYEQQFIPAAIGSGGAGSWNVQSVIRDREWETAFLNFDNVGQAILTLLTLLFNDGWTTVLYNVMDSRNESEAMELNARPASAIYCIAFMLIANFFLLNLFIGALVRSYSDESDVIIGILDSNGRRLLTEAQQYWVRTYQMVRATQLRPPVARAKNAVRRFCCWIVFEDDDCVQERKAFEFGISGLIVVNLAFLCSVHAHQPQFWEDALYIVNMIFAGIFAVEAVIKIIAMMPQVYFQVGWNRFDFALVPLTFLGLILAGTGVNAIRVLRVVRVLRLIKRADGLRRLFASITQALPQLGNVTVLIVLLLFVYGVIGTTIFGNLNIEPLSGEEPILTETYNFRNVGNSMIVLFGVATMSGWTSLMRACVITPENSRCTDAAGDCGTQAAYPFFISFIVLTNAVALNLFIYVILDNYLSLFSHAESRSQVLFDRLNYFRSMWQVLDPEGTRTIPAVVFIQVMRRVFGNLGGTDELNDSDKRLLRKLRREMEELRRVDEVVVHATGMDDGPLGAVVQCDSNSSNSHAGTLPRPGSLLRGSHSHHNSMHRVQLAVPMSSHHPGVEVGADADQRDDATAVEMHDVQDGRPLVVVGSGPAPLKTSSVLASGASSSVGLLKPISELSGIVRLRLMDVPLDATLRVHYNDCVLGITREHFSLSETESLRAAKLLQLPPQHDPMHHRTAFKIHHMLAARSIQRIFRRVIAGRKVARSAAAAAALAHSSHHNDDLRILDGSSSDHGAAVAVGLLPVGSVTAPPQISFTHDSFAAPGSAAASSAAAGPSAMIDHTAHGGCDDTDDEGRVLAQIAASPELTPRDSSRGATSGTVASGGRVGAGSPAQRVLLPASSTAGGTLNGHALEAGGALPVMTPMLAAEAGAAPTFFARVMIDSASSTRSDMHGGAHPAAAGTTGAASPVAPLSTSINPANGAPAAHATFARPPMAPKPPRPPSANATTTLPESPHLNNTRSSLGAAATAAVRRASEAMDDHLAQ